MDMALGVRKDTKMNIFGVPYPKLRGGPQKFAFSFVKIVSPKKSNWLVFWWRENWDLGLGIFRDEGDILRDLD